MAWKMVGGVLTWVGGGTSTKKPKPGGSTGGGTGGGYSGGSGGGSGGGTKAATTKDGELTPEQLAQLKRQLTHNYNALFGGGSRALPPGLWNEAKKGRWSDSGSIDDWMRANLGNGLYEKTTAGKSRMAIAELSLESIFGEADPKLKDRIMHMWLKMDPGVNQQAQWDNFLDTKIVKSKEFLAAMPGWQAFKAQFPKMDNAEAIDKYTAVSNGILGWYKTALKKWDATLPAGLLASVLAAGITDEENFVLYLKANDQGYKDATDAALLTTDMAKYKAEQFDDFWASVYGDSAVPDPLLRTAFMKSNEATDFEAYFNNFIRNTAEFKAKVPGFEAWAAGQTGGMDNQHVDPLKYFTDKQTLEQEYEVLAEKIGATDPALIERAMAGNWSLARLKLEFKSSSAYTQTADYKERAAGLSGYWKSIFGVDAPVDPAMADEFARGSSTDVTSMFDSIKKTALFRQQYGNWAEFQGAQDSLGQSGQIMNNPGLYKSYRAAFYQAFADVGIAPPPEYEKMFFSSGIDQQEITANLSAYANTSESDKWMSGEAADVATAAGIGDKVAGGDLQLRMKRAWEAHKTYANSNFTSQDTKKSESGIITQGI